MGALLILATHPATAGTLELGSTVTATTPDILAYNLGHFHPGGNTIDWLRYSGVNGARIFISPKEIEPTDDLPGIGDGVTDQPSFLARRNALRTDPLSRTYIDWPDFEDRYENNLLGSSDSGNRIRLNFALGQLREKNIAILAQITASESALPIQNEQDWAGKWELWQHYYAQAFHLGRHFDVERYQMYNEPDHPNANGLTPANWLMRLRLVSDAIQSALADLNLLYQKNLSPLIYAPVNAGNAYTDWALPAINSRHTNFLGQTDPDYLVMHRYDYHQYNSSPSRFGSNLNTLRSNLTRDMAPETRFPMSISEFNVHTNGTFQGMPATLDTPSKYSRLGAITVHLIENFQKELYCFKYSQTTDPTAPYGVKKNGMHYVQNGTAPYHTGGATAAAEVWRLSNKAHAPGGQQLSYTRDSDGSIDDLHLRATSQPNTGNYHLFSANDTDSPIPLTLDTSSWNLPSNTPFILEEVSTQSLGTARLKGTLSTLTTTLTQPAHSVWLFTIPQSPLQPPLLISTTADSTVIDGTNSLTNYANSQTLTARNHPTSANQRAVAFTKFDLPVIYPPDIQLATLHLQTQTTSSSANPIQAHLYGLENDTWSSNTLTWKNAPNLLKNTDPGTLISNRVITGQGDTLSILAQLLATQTTPSPQTIDVTTFLQNQPDGAASFLISQDPRWDTALPDLTPGDPQEAGLQITSSKGATPSNPGPQLTLHLLPDRDQDGLSDQAEITHFLTDPDQADSDQDGQNDGHEIFAETNPNDPQSHFKIDSLQSLSQNQIQLHWQTIPHRTYSVQISSTLHPQNWTTIHTTPGTGTPTSFTVPAAPPSGFYRIQISY